MAAEEGREGVERCKNTEKMMVFLAVVLQGVRDGERG